MVPLSEGLTLLALVFFLSRTILLFLQDVPAAWLLYILAMLTGAVVTFQSLRLKLSLHSEDIARRHRHLHIMIQI